MPKRSVTDRTWYVLLGAVVVAEAYEGGGVQFFTEDWTGQRRFFTDMRRLDEEGEVVSEEEARARLAGIRSAIEARRAARTAPPEIQEGDWVWFDGPIGRVDHVMTEGELNLGDVALPASPDDPALLVSVWEDRGFSGQRAVKAMAAVRVFAPQEAEAASRP
jgi:hypothetical protein